MLECFICKANWINLLNLFYNQAFETEFLNGPLLNTFSLLVHSQDPPPLHTLVWQKNVSDLIATLQTTPKVLTINKHHPKD